MLYLGLLILFIWLIGVILHIAGGLIHVLLLVALALILLNFLGDRL